jgi:hypothetical protein
MKKTYSQYRFGEVVVDPITDIIGRGPENIHIIENFLEGEELQKVLRYVKLKLKKRSDQENILFELLEDDKKLVYSCADKMHETAEKIYKMELIRDKDLDLGVREKLISLDMHTDVLEEQKRSVDRKIYWSGHVSTLIYLNDNYEGGEIYFPGHDLEIKPKAGMFITFPGNPNYVHGVHAASENRYTLSMFIKFAKFKEWEENEENWKS